MRKYQRQIWIYGTKHVKKQLLESERNSAMKVATWVYL